MNVPPKTKLKKPIINISCGGLPLYLVQFPVLKYLSTEYKPHFYDLKRVFELHVADENVT